MDTKVRLFNDSVDPVSNPEQLQQPHAPRPESPSQQQGRAESSERVNGKRQDSEGETDEQIRHAKRPKIEQDAAAQCNEIPDDGTGASDSNYDEAGSDVDSDGT